MYRLIIVDDEKMIRQGICDYIDWKSMGFSVVDTFEDGKEALDYLEKNHVDVVLTDIEMAEVSGLEMAQYMKENHLTSRVVIISGYKEFEYARKAVEYGVEHYLLKPIRMEEVTRVFLKIAKDLDVICAQKESKLHEERKFAKLLPQLREQSAFALADVRLLEKDDEFFHYYEGENYHNLINNMFGGSDDDINCYPICLSDSVVKIIMTTLKQESAEDFFVRASAQIQSRCEAANSLLKLTFQAEMECVFDSAAGLMEYRCGLSYQDTKEAKQYSDLSAEDYERLMQQYKLIMSMMNDGDFEALNNIVDHIFREFRMIPIEQVQKLCIDMFSMLSGKLVKMGIDIWTVWNQKLSYQEITGVKDLKELKERTKRLLNEVIHMVKDKQNVSSRHFVEESIKYMKKHYGEEISLEVIANKFFLNQTYFSRLFKQYTGSTFTDYLIELRMEQAKKLLSQGKYKVYEVSQMVGYRSEKYFFRIFKQYAGCSPTEYYRGTKLDD